MSEPLSDAPREPLGQPLRFSFQIDCPPTHAFEVWTTRMAAWWPKGHTTSGDPGAVVTLEPRLGGRIFERTGDGTEIDWGQVTSWEPPARLGYLWHIGRDRSQATDVELHFVDNGDGTTRLDIVHAGWERLGAAGVGFRQANTAGWEALVPSFQAAAASRT
jgi:Activator of Hsp90 ATPase homolog 1-like protein